MKAVFFAVLNLAISAYAQTTAMMDITTDMMTMMDSTTGASDTVVPKSYSPVYSLVFIKFSQRLLIEGDKEEKILSALKFHLS